MGKVITKVTSAIITTILVFSNLLVLGGEVIAYGGELEEQNTKTNNSKVEFNSYFDDGVHGKEYKVVFGYGLLTKTDVLDKVQGITDGKERSLQKMISLLPELLLAGLQKKHKEEFGYESDSEKEAALDKVCDLLDDYEDEGTEENPKSGFDLYQLLDKELEKNGFLSGLLNAVAEAQAVEKNATKLPQDHKKKN